MTDQRKPAITTSVTIEEAYFLLRTAMWDQEDFKEYIDVFETQAYEAGYEHGHDYASSTTSEQEFERGYDRGLKDGVEEGWREGYDQGYDEASKDSDYRR